MPSCIVTLILGLQWVVLALRRTRSSITVGLGRGLRLVILNWHVACARAELYRLRLQVPAGIWVCDGCRQVPWDVDSFSSHARMHRRIALPITRSQLRQQRRRSGMSTRFTTGAMFAILGGFVVVVSQAFSPSVAGWVTFGVGIAFGLGASGRDVTWLRFAVALGTVGMAFAGLSLNEVANRRLNVGLSNLRWLPVRSPGNLRCSTPAPREG